VFGDATLRDMARRRPSTLERLLDVHGVGEKKAADFGQQFVGCIASHCRQHGIAIDVQPEQSSRQPPAAPSTNAFVAFPLFDEGLSVEQAAERLGRAVSTTYGYLESYIRQRRVTDVTRWIPRRGLDQIQVVVAHAGAERLKPIHDALHGRISYEQIRVAIAYMANENRLG
jgi:ATP-dependent DNA helicase RecQ